MNLSAAKQLSISLGLYKPARSLHRLIFKSEGTQFAAHRALLSQFVGPGDLAFDVGANIGDRTEIMLSLGASVVAFEPQPECTKEIRARGNGKLIVVEKVVGANVGTTDFHIKTDNTKSSLAAEWFSGANVGVLKVQITTLDQAIKQYGKPRFCKIDVEGFEVDVFRGLSSPLDAISFEYRCSEAGTSAVFSCLEMLSGLGEYRVNMTAQEGANFIFPQWLSIPGFLGVFPDRARPHYYGDIYAKLVLA